MAQGVYGWRCVCGFSTARSRERLDKSVAAACYPCRILVEDGGKTTCEGCASPLTAFDSEGTFVEVGDRTAAMRHWRERLLDETLRERYWTRGHPKPPFPTDATMALPGGWSRQTDQTRAYDEWLHGMGRAWRTDKPRAMADRQLVEEVLHDIEPMIEEGVARAMSGARKYKCPACGAFALEFVGVPFPVSG